MANLEKLKAILEDEEGRVSHAYKDHLGYLTIGVGHLIDKRKGGGLPDPIIDALLHYDVCEKIEEVTRHITFWNELSDNRQQALVLMAFQLGTNGLLKFKNMLSALQLGDWNKAYAEALNSRWAQQTPARAERVAKMLKDG